MKRSQEECREEFLKKNLALYAEYQLIEKDFVMSEVKKAFWITGSKQKEKVLFLAHGYMGTPNEMKYIAEPFIKAGWTVVGFLIPGHGASSQIANAFLKKRWRMEMQQQLSMILESFEEVRAVGFSTGGLLLHDFILHQPLQPSFKSLHLISPYFIQRIGGRLKLFDPLIKKLFNNISLDRAYGLSKFPDLRVMTIDRPSYNQSIPVRTAREIKGLGEEIFNRAAPQKKLSLPVQLFLSENDWTVKTDASKKVIYRDVEADKIELVWYPGKEPHHLMAPTVSNVAKKIQELIFTYCNT